VDTKNPDQGPLLITSGEKDHQVPWAISHSSYKHQKHNSGVTEIVEIPGRGHSLTIDSGWREVADICLEFIQRVVAPDASTRTKDDTARSEGVLAWGTWLTSIWLTRNRSMSGLTFSPSSHSVVAFT
jgi:hypothetical protein